MCPYNQPNRQPQALASLSVSLSLSLFFETIDEGMGRHGSTQVGKLLNRVNGGVGIL